MFRIFCFLGLIVAVFGDETPWQSLVDEQLIQKGLTHGAILSNDGSVLAVSDGFSLNDGDGAALVSAFENFSGTLSDGIRVAGIKYLTTKANPDSLYGKKGAGGICIVKTKETIVIGVYGSSMPPSAASVKVESLGEYLREQGH